MKHWKRRAGTEAEREAELTDSMIAMLRRHLDRTYPEGQAKRAFHTKHYALVHAEFSVPDLPESLRRGIFRKPTTFEAVIRLSSGEVVASPDSVKSSHGLAIKVMGVEGGDFVQDAEPGCQDFVLSSGPTLPVGTVEAFHDAMYWGERAPGFVYVLKMMLTGKLKRLKAFGNVRQNPTSPFDIRYWSVTPHAFGPDRQVKYAVKPTSAFSSERPKRLTADYMTDQVQKHLDRGEAAFDFFVQFRRPELRQPLDDVSVEWLESDSPLVKVARIVVPPQQVRSSERDTLAERLTFSPGNALQDHEPLGEMNRARVKAYRELSRYRHDRNARRGPGPGEASAAQPTGGRDRR